MKTKEEELLNYLFQKQGEYCTASMLAKELQVSERTIRNYSKNLQQCVSKHGASLISKQGYGYQLVIERAMQFELFINQGSNLKKRAPTTKKLIDSLQERQHFILNKLLLEDEHVFLETLCDELFVSKSTINKELHIIKEILQRSNLDLIHQHGLGFWIEGTESDKRSFIMDYFFKGTPFNSIQEYTYQTSYFNDMPSAKLILIIIEECRNGRIKLSDVMVQNILIHLMLSIKRIDKKVELKNLKIDYSLVDNIELIVAKRIIERMEIELNIKFPKEEVNYLILHLGAKNNKSLITKDIDQDKLELELTNALLKLDNDGNFSLSDDTLFRNNLLEHLRPMLLRMNQSIHLENPLLQDILENHKEIFDITKKYLSDIQSLKKYTISDDEWAYLTLHFMSAMERMKQREKLQVLVICATGYGSAQLLKNRIEKEFNGVINVVSEIGYFEMSEALLEGIDLIISSVNLASVITGVPFIHVSVFLDEKDIAEIHQFVSKRDAGVSDLTQLPYQLHTLHEKQEIFDSYFHAERFLVFENNISRDDLMNCLISSLEEKRSGFIKDMKDQIKLRENMSAIVFSDRIAVPHPAIPLSEKGKLAVAIIPDGVVWSDEFHDIKFVLLLSPSCLGNAGIKFITQTLVHFIDREDLQENLINDPTFANFKNIFIGLM